MTETTVARRGTSNSNERGNAEQRRKRREWLVETYRADVDIAVMFSYLANRSVTIATVSCGEGIPACRCFRCGTLLTTETVTVDRIIEGCNGGTYRRNNIRPACGRCNSSLGGKTRRKK